MRLFPLFLIAVLFLSACASTPEQEPTTQEPTVQTQEIVQEPAAPSTDSQPEQPAVKPDTATTSLVIQSPQTTVEKIEGFGTEASGKTYINRLHLTLSSAVVSEMVIDISSKFYNGSYVYNATLNCSKPNAVVLARNKYFGFQEIKGKPTVCFSPPRDLTPAQDLTVSATYKEQNLFSYNLKTPSAFVGTYIILETN